MVKCGFPPLSILYVMVLYQRFLEPDAPMVVQFAEMGILSMAICFLWYLLLAQLLGRVRTILLN